MKKKRLSNDIDTFFSKINPYINQILIIVSKKEIEVEIEEIINYSKIIYDGYIIFADFTKIDSFLDLIVVIFDDVCFYYKKNYDTCIFLLITNDETNFFMISF